MYLGRGALRGFGLDSREWSKTVSSYTGPTSGSTIAYYLHSDYQTVNPSFGPNGRYHGFPVRCLVILC